MTSADRSGALPAPPGGGVGRERPWRWIGLTALFFLVCCGVTSLILWKIYQGPITSWQLHEAVEHRNVAAAAYWLDRGADVDAPTEELRSTPLMRAARHDDLAMLQLLLSRGANLRAVNSSGSGVVNQAISRRPQSLACVRFLLDHGASLEENRRASDTPLWGAASMGYLEIARELVAHGARVNLRDPKEGSLLRVVRKRGHRDVERFLIAASTQSRSQRPIGKSD